jgi:hypothetical protein
MSPPHFFSSSDLVYWYSAGTTTVSLFKYKRSTRVLSDACNTVLLTSMCERSRMMSPLFRLL